MPELQTLLDLYQQQPFLAYSLLASFILAVVSLSSGLFRLDILSTFTPKALLGICLAVFAALSISYFGKTLLANGASADAIALSMSRLPLYFITLALGPSAGLLAGALFLSFGDLIHFPELILLLELSVLGWFAISPSPRHFWWAGPFCAVLAYLLTWAAAGSAYLQWQTGDGSSLRHHLSLHNDSILSMVFVIFLLALILPSVYERFFPFSAIAPKSPDLLAQPVIAESTEPQLADFSLMHKEKTKLRSLAQPANLTVFSPRQKRSKEPPIPITSPKLVKKAPHNRNLRS